MRMFSPALYYPYIHFRDVNWLKASLLWFQQVRRIVPPDFAFNDIDEVRELHDLAGTGDNPLIKDEPAYAFCVWEAQKRLLAVLQAQPTRFLDQFTRARAIKDVPDGAQAFQMHRGKMIPLVEFLTENKLAWKATGFRRDRPDDWLALHPKLGEAIMSTIAVAIARDSGLGIVTGEGRIHRALAELDEALILQQLAGISAAPARQKNTDRLRDDLALTIFTTGFDVSKLTPIQIAELIREGKDLSRFKQRLDDDLKNTREIENPKERRKRLEHTAKEIIKEWKAQKKSLPKYAIDALIPLSNERLPSAATSMIAGATGIATVGTGVGLVIAFAVYLGINTWQRFREASDHPLNYLSTIHQAGATLVVNS